MLKGKRFTTINTDAGIKKSIAAYSYWIRSEEVVLVNSDRFKLPKKDSTEAELAAMLVALRIVARNEYLRAADVIVVNCDSKGALEILRDNKITKDSIYYEEWQNIRSLIKAPIYYKWVKGHSKGKTPREWVNNFIDKQIRKHYNPR
jgi:ribonuclease HI